MTWLLWMALQETWKFRYFFGSLISFPLVICPVVAMLNHTAVLFLVFEFFCRGNSIQFSIMTLRTCIPNNVKGSHFLQILMNNFSFIFLVLFIITWGNKINFHLSDGFHHFFICLLYMTNVYSNLLFVFKLGCLFSCYWIKFTYIFILIHYRVHDLPIFPTICKLGVDCIFRFQETI